MAPKDEKSPFRKRVLVPFWTIRILILALSLLVYALAIGTLGVYARENNENFGSAIAVLVVIMLVVLVCLILDVVCIVQRSRRTLTPKAFLIMSVVQTALWTVIFIVSLVSSVAGSAAASAIVAIILYAFFIGSLIYASVLYHRSRKGTLKNWNQKAGGKEAYDTELATAPAPAPAPAGTSPEINMGYYR